MKIKDITKMQTAEDNLHESLFRSYHILEKVKDYLHRKVPDDVIIELIEEMEQEELED